MCEVVRVVFTAMMCSLVEREGAKPDEGTRYNMCEGIKRFRNSMVKGNKAVLVVMEKRLDEERHTSHLVAMAVTKRSLGSELLRSTCHSL